ncbi:MAG: copper amine oxidase N-terminal domain-containing protein [Bacillota bacterium]
MKPIELRIAATCLMLLTLLGGTALAKGPVHGETITVEGVVELVPGGVYGAGGRVLLGDTTLLQKLLGQHVWVVGRHEGGDTSLKLNVERIERAVPLNRTLPTAVTVNKSRVSYDQAPYMHKGTLMLPLRALAEAAGGQVEWRAESQTAYVRLNDRTAYFTVGKAQAELHLHAAIMVDRMRAMDQQVVLQGGRMFISADAVTGILGMSEEVTADDTTLHLLYPERQFEVPSQADLTYNLRWSGELLEITGRASIPDLQFEIRLDGKVIAQSDAQVKDGAYITNILVEGGAAQTGKLELVISDPATGRVLVTTSAKNEHG